MSNKLRLLLFEQCNRNCSGCCNKDWDLANLPIVNDFSKYGEILLTGGEPLLYPRYVKGVIDMIRVVSKANIYVYTAKVDEKISALGVVLKADGMTLTLHDWNDVYYFLGFNSFLLSLKGWVKGKSFRLNVFSGIDLPDCDLRLWKVKKDIEWIKDCPLPENEDFMRL